MPDYTRVIPRDLFNEAKLLKGLGRLCLLIHDDLAPPGLRFEHDGEAFRIRQYEDDGSLYAANVSFVWCDTVELDLRSPYNNTHAYPLFCDSHAYGVVTVFDDSGNLTPEFVDFLHRLPVDQEIE